MKLYTYWRSTAAYRVRIALNLKQIDAEYESVHLVKEGGEQHSAEYTALNPQELVPTLVDGEYALNQSMAIIEYLDEKHPEPALLPKDAVTRALVRALAQAIACDIHPLNNLRVLQYLEYQCGMEKERRKHWYTHWIMEGFQAVEAMLGESHNTDFCFGDTPTLADLCLIPQVYNANRFEINLGSFPTIKRINEHCLGLDAFEKAAPENQKDAE